jgi:hypothetical protein
MMESTQVGHGEFGGKRCGNGSKQRCSVGGKNNVIHIKEKICNISATAKNKK